MSSGFRSSCYWTDWNWANTKNIRIGLVFAVLAQWKFLYCIDRFDHIKANKSKLINKSEYCYAISPVIHKWFFWESRLQHKCTWWLQFFFILKFWIFFWKFGNFMKFYENWNFWKFRNFEFLIGNFWNFEKKIRVSR